MLTATTTCHTTSKLLRRFALYSLGVFLTLLSLSARAQSVGTAEFIDPDAFIHHIYADLDQSQITTGLLAERTAPLFPIRFFRGDSARVDSLAFDMDGYTMGVASLFGMAADSLSATARVPLSFRESLPPVSDTLDLSTQLFQFNYIDSVAAQAGGLCCRHHRAAALRCAWAHGEPLPLGYGVVD